jgi:outer membrane protein OmpA-like peptidoglycan-associated protein
MKNAEINIWIKATGRVLFILSLLVLISKSADAQFLNKLQKHAESKVEREAEKRANRKVDKQIDKGFDAAEDALEGNTGTSGKEESQKSNSDNDNSSTSQESNSGKTDAEVSEASEATKEPTVVWNKFDFVPGDIVVFEDGPDISEENGEFPSRWDLVNGQVEIATVDGENVMMFIDGQAMIVPYLKNAKEDYLPDVFTIEFDFYKPVSGNRISVYLYDDKNQTHANRDMYMDIGSGGVSEKLSGVSGDLPGIDYNNREDARWIHVSIAFTKGKLKVYMDDTRVINIPHYTGNPTGLTLQAYFAELKADKPFYFKNICIAEGGVKYYDRVLSDGKIVVNGIRFDVNKATLKPESMGPINEIYELMQKNPELNFIVEGHTDSDGDDVANQKLSEARAKAVMDQLITMGISANRLKSGGWGESKPVDANASSEGKANNRRVEFVKF